MTTGVVDTYERTEPFVSAGLTGNYVEPVAVPDPSISYEHRGVGETTGHGLRQDPNDFVQAHPLRLFAHGVSTFVVMLAAGLTMISMAPGLFGYESVVVTSGSMEPTIRIADVVVTAPTSGRDLGPGAVINFERGEGMVLHRITEVDDLGYRTTGDANRAADSELVEPKDIRGVGVVVVPLVGLPRRWVDQGQWLQLGATAVLLAGALHMSRRTWPSARRERWAP